MVLFFLYNLNFSFLNLFLPNISFDSKINIKKTGQNYDLLDKYILGKEDWTVDRLILLGAISSKAFNLGTEPIIHLETSIRECSMSFQTASMLACTLLPGADQLNCGVRDFPIDFCKRKAEKLPKLYEMVVSELDIAEADEAVPVGTQTYFHRLTSMGISPIVQNLFIPMGLRSITENKHNEEDPDHYALCPFPVGGFNHRIRSSEIELNILETLFADTPEFKITDDYVMLSLSKKQSNGEDKILSQTLVESTATQDRTKFGIELINHEADKSDRCLVGTDYFDKPPRKVYGSYPLVHNKEIQDQIYYLYASFDWAKKFEGACTIIHLLRGDKEVFKKPLFLPHYLILSFKLQCEIWLRKWMQKNIQDKCEELNDPSVLMQSMAKLMRTQGGDSFIPCFKILDETISCEDRKNQPLPLHAHIVKVLLQGRSSIIDQGVEGNHRLAVQAALLSGSLSTEQFRMSSSKLLNVDLLFGEAQVYQLIPSVSTTFELKRKKVSTMAVI